MNKRLIIIPAAVLVTAGIGLGVFMAIDRVKLTTDKIVMEAGDEFYFNAASYVEASERKLSKLVIDTSKVDMSAVGTYEILITYKNQDLILNVDVEDTTAPVIEETQDTISVKVGAEISVNDLGVTVKDISQYKLTFEDGMESTVFDTYGEIKKKIIATDIYQNKQDAELVFKVLDANPPELYGDGIKDKTVYIENPANLLESVYARDAEDGDITDKITVNEVDLTVPGEKELIYTVEDLSGNITSQIVRLSVESVIEELDKSMYAQNTLSVRASSNDDGEKLGSMSYAQKVHVTGRDKVTGWYQIEFKEGIGYVPETAVSDNKPKENISTSGNTDWNNPIDDITDNYIEKRIALNDYIDRIAGGM